MLSYCNYIRGKNGPTLLVLAGLELEVGIRDGSTFAILLNSYVPKLDGWRREKRQV